MLGELVDSSTSASIVVRDGSLVGLDPIAEEEYCVAEEKSFSDSSSSSSSFDGDILLKSTFIYSFLIPPFFHSPCQVVGMLTIRRQGSWEAASG